MASRALPSVPDACVQRDWRAISRLGCRRGSAITLRRCVALRRGSTCPWATWSRGTWYVELQVATPFGREQPRPSVATIPFQRRRSHVPRTGAWHSGHTRCARGCDFLRCKPGSRATAIVHMMSSFYSRGEHACPLLFCMQVYQLEGLGVNCSNWNNTGPTGERDPTRLFCP